MKAQEVIEVDPEKMGGTPVFKGTRVPIQHLFDYIKGGDSLEVFLDHFPTVEREQALALMELIQERILGEYEKAAA
ncbi:MAG: DUF433 domain-containing protein [Blastocatellia bacterium]